MDENHAAAADQDSLSIPDSKSKNLPLLLPSAMDENLASAGRDLEKMSLSIPDSKSRNHLLLFSSAVDENPAAGGQDSEKSPSRKYEWPSGDNTWSFGRYLDRSSGGEGRSVDLERISGEEGRLLGDRRAECKVFFKGMVTTERVDVYHGYIYLAGLGVTISIPDSGKAMAISEPIALVDDSVDYMSNPWAKRDPPPSKEEADLKALIHVLELVKSMGINTLEAFCNSMVVVEMINNEASYPEHEKVGVIVKQVKDLIEGNFSYFRLRNVGSDETKPVIKLAREAILEQIIKKSGGKEICKDCHEHKSSTDMVAVYGCLHRFCKKCTNRYLEEQIPEVAVPKCRVTRCEAYVTDLFWEDYVSTDSSERFISLYMADNLLKRIKEAHIPLEERVYCSYPECSELVSKSKISGKTAVLRDLPKLESSRSCNTVVALAKREVFHHPKSGLAYEKKGVWKCMKCLRLSCQNCMVPWHYGRICEDFKIENPDSLLDLAAEENWHRCKRCNHMIQPVSEGDLCADLTCRCGYTFCYHCGKEWDEADLTDYHTGSRCCDSEEEGEEEEEEEEKEEEEEEEHPVTLLFPVH